MQRKALDSFPMRTTFYGSLCKDTVEKTLLLYRLTAEYQLIKNMSLVRSPMTTALTNALA